MSLRLRCHVVFATLICVEFFAACHADTASTPDAPQSEVAAAIRDGHAPLLLDVRTPQEYASGHVPGARNISIDELPARESELGAERDRPVVVYCEKGGRAARGAKLLAAAGFTSVRLLAGHMSAWRDSGLPTE
ncbi:MAG TPA: rhodanese-like domain-containing protein [Myxococcota bacterium]|nr:rhodanese-like domain-containing protein [Myxococcota bacterium]